MKKKFFKFLKCTLVAAMCFSGLVGLADVQTVQAVETVTEEMQEQLVVEDEFHDLMEAILLTDNQQGNQTVDPAEVERMLATLEPAENQDIEEIPVVKSGEEAPMVLGTTQSLANLETLKNYIVNYGSYNSNGNKFIRQAYQTFTYGIEYDSSNNTLQFVCIDSTYLASCALKISLSTGEPTEDASYICVSTGTHCLVPFPIYAFTQDTILSFYSADGDYLLVEEELVANAYFQLSMILWKELVGETTGLSMSDIGFLSYDAPSGSCATNGNHNIVTIPGTEATCISSGLTQGSYCSSCGTVFATQTEIPMKAHQLVEFGAQEATCGVAGYTAGQRCAICGTVVVAPQTIPAKEHVWETNGTVTQEPTSTSFGILTYRCIYDANHTRTENFLRPTETNPFGDVLAGTWQFDPVKYAYDNGVMTGKGSMYGGGVKFDPEGKITRAEFAQVLYSMAGRPDVTYEAWFSDVPDGEWYTSAVIWAKQNNIVAGKGDIFDVSGQITREEVATMFKQYAAYKGYDVSERASLNTFTDASQVSSWATENMSWVVAKGIMAGKGENLDPTGKATRAECSAMLRTFDITYAAQ